MMAISNLARRALIEHAKEPDKIFYADKVLGGMFGDSDIDQLDAAYKDLEANKLMESAGATISYFGAPKNLYRITEKGKQEAKPTAA